ncbi:MAG TPA: M56 family metallopeptidase [Candidatus Acidoferrum sp.]|nr:M56 family metallopeptidase [Candidatus Acidoferrum sp.]
MILPYLVRLLCLCFACLFLVNAVCTALLRPLAMPVMRFAERKPASTAARLLFLCRLLPFAFAILFVLGLCVPSYLWLEPSATSERVGIPCALLALLGCATWLFSLARSVRALANACARNAQWNSTVCENLRSRTSGSLLVLEENSPILALSGLFRPHLVVSRSVLKSLSADELDAALSHEQAHFAARDNFKRLLFLLTPEPLPLVRPLRPLEERWSKLAEWAADDHAVRGDSVRALSLASALVQVARLGAAPDLPALSTSLLACDRDLSSRVARLLAAGTAPADRGSRAPLLLRPLYGWLAAGLAFALLLPALLPPIHRLLERFLH